MCQSAAEMGQRHVHHHSGISFAHVCCSEFWTRVPLTLRAWPFWMPSPTYWVRCIACPCGLVYKPVRGAWLLEISVLWMISRLFNNLFLSHFIALKVQTGGMVGTIRTVQIVEVLIKIKFTILAHWGKTFCVWLVLPLLDYLGILRLAWKGIQPCV